MYGWLRRGYQTGETVTIGITLCIIKAAYKKFKANGNIRKCRKYINEFFKYKNMCSKKDKPLDISHTVKGEESATPSDHPLPIKPASYIERIKRRLFIYRIRILRNLLPSRRLEMKLNTGIYFPTDPIARMMLLRRYTR